jgi:hypothetical protein
VTSQAFHFLLQEVNYFENVKRHFQFVPVFTNAVAENSRFRISGFNPFNINAVFHFHNSFSLSKLCNSSHSVISPEADFMPVILKELLQQEFLYKTPSRNTGLYFVKC